MTMAHLIAFALLLLVAAAFSGPRLPRVWLARAIGPLGTGVIAASARVRQRQHGHLPDYILCLVAGPAALGGLVVFGSMR